MDIPPTTPAAGPDRIVCTGLAIASEAVVVPPFDCIICKSDFIPISLTA